MVCRAATVHSPATRRAVPHVWNVRRRAQPSRKGANNMAFILWIVAVALVIWGIITLVRGGVLMGIVLIVLGLIIGPGGYSIFSR